MFSFILKFPNWSSKILKCTLSIQGKNVYKIENLHYQCSDWFFRQYKNWIYMFYV